ncbi:hypothetical protein DL95DRAFT_136645 [Leptodontidium sp. 2 PMI_412]|nr:hypothetical protein DL95DRAFT_136645 [Leptodontidium sp. 2 PMI_412]
MRFLLFQGTVPDESAHRTVRTRRLFAPLPLQGEVRGPRRMRPPECCFLLLYLLLAEPIGAKHYKRLFTRLLVLSCRTSIR